MSKYYLNDVSFGIYVMKLISEVGLCLSHEAFSVLCGYLKCQEMNCQVLSIALSEMMIRWSVLMSSFLSNDLTVSGYL